MIPTFMRHVDLARLTDDLGDVLCLLNRRGNKLFKLRPQPGYLSGEVRAHNAY